MGTRSSVEFYEVAVAKGVQGGADLLPGAD